MSTDQSFFRDPQQMRVLACCWIAVAATCYSIDLWRQTAIGLTDGVTRPFGDDFINYWSGAYLAFHGRIRDVYDFAAFHEFQSAVVAGPIQNYHYGYSPFLLLMTSPLALLAYVPGLVAWLASGWYALYRALRQVLPAGSFWLALAAPAVLINAIGGQNGMWTAALLGGGLCLIDRRPVVAGMLLGLLAYKPHLALALPIALVCGRRWATLAAAGLTALILSGLTVALWGPDPWLSFAARADELRRFILEDGTGVWHRMVSVFVLVRHCGASVAVAYGVQIAMALAAAAVVAAAWWRDDFSPDSRNAVTVLGGCLMTPYLQDYDLVFLVFVVAWLWRDESLRHRRSSHVIYVAALVLPGTAAAIAALTGIAVGGIVLPLMLVLLLRLVSVEADRQARQARPLPG